MDKTHYTLCAMIEPSGKTIRISKLLSGELGDMLDFIEAGAAATRTKASVCCWRAGCKKMVSSVEFDYRPEETEITSAFSVRHGSEGQKPLDNPTLAQMCYYVRSSFGLTQKEMGKKLGVDQSMVCRIESGEMRGECKWSADIKQMYEQLTAEPWTPPTAFQIKEVGANG